MQQHGDWRLQVRIGDILDEVISFGRSLHENACGVEHVERLA
jgi:hypothetical protein